MDEFGFHRVAAAVPTVRIGNPSENAQIILELLGQAEAEGCELVVFPELCLTGYTCADLFFQETLLDAAKTALHKLVHDSHGRFGGVYLVGLPWAIDGRLYNVAVVIQNGRVLGLVPKQHIPNYKEFYERRWFCPAPPNLSRTVTLDGPILLSPRQIFSLPHDPRLAIGVEICEDLWVPIPPSSRLALDGASILVNLSASNDLTTKADYRRELVLSQSARLLATYIYASSGPTESTTDLVFGGHALIAENGVLLAESKRFERKSQLIVADIDLERVAGDRARQSNYSGRVHHGQFTRVAVSANHSPPTEGLRRPVPAHPFVPAASERLGERCSEIFHIQVAGLAKRLEMVKTDHVVIGVSGGLDSTLALLVAVRTYDALSWDRKAIHGITMPGFGTSQRTRSNATHLMEYLGIRSEEIDIRQLCLDTWRGLGHRPFGIDTSTLDLNAFTAALAQIPADQRNDIVFENVQARVRMLILMSRGFVVGTGDLSELALGWTTYNADHMSMYNPNVSVPKTLVRFLVRWVADHELDGPARGILHSIADTQISPELLPISKEGAIQSTEGTIGPYELHDFFLYHVLRFGFSPRKILHLARHARFDHEYSEDEVQRWLIVFYRRFFASQFKRSCLPDGPKVGTVSLSPRGDWRMPSDADVAAWLDDLGASSI